MGAVAWGALLSAIALAILAVRLERWRRTLPVSLDPTQHGTGGADAPSIDLRSIDLRSIGMDVHGTDPTRIDPTRIDPTRIDLAGIERAERAEALAFDGIVGHLLLSDPTFADSADRLARQDEPGPAA